MFPSSAPASWDDIMYMLRRIEARLDASEQSWTAQQAYPRPEPEFDPILGRPLTSWDLPRPRIAPELCSNHSYSESYGGGGGYSNNYESQAWPYNNYESQAWSHNNYESQAWSYNTYEPDRYNHVPQPVQYEPPPPAQYYADESDRYNHVKPPPKYCSVAELQPQPQHYYSQPPSYNHVPDVDTTLEADVNDSETRGEARGDVIVVDSSLEEIGVEESTTMADPKLEVADADAGYEQQLSELQTEPNIGGDELNPAMEEADAEKGKDGLSPAYVAMVCVTSACGVSDLILAPRLHSHVFQAKRLGKSKVLMMNFLIDTHGNCGRMDLVCRVFCEMEDNSVVARRLVIFGLYALDEVYKEFESSP